MFLLLKVAPTSLKRFQPEIARHHITWQLAVNVIIANVIIANLSRLQPHVYAARARDRWAGPEPTAKAMNCWR